MPYFTIISGISSALIGFHIGFSWWLIPALVLAPLAGYGAGKLDDEF